MSTITELFLCRWFSHDSLATACNLSKVIILKINFFSTCNFYFLFTIFISCLLPLLSFPFLLFNLTRCVCPIHTLLYLKRNPQMLCLSFTINKHCMLSISSSNCAVLVAPTKILHANGIIGFIKFSTSVNAFCVL